MTSIKKGWVFDHSGKVHFHQSDSRFCGSTLKGRRITFDPNEVTCRACMAKDCFVLSADAVEYLRSLPSAAPSSHGP